MRWGSRVWWISPGYTGQIGKKIYVQIYVGIRLEEGQWIYSRLPQIECM